MNIQTYAMRSERDGLAISVLEATPEGKMVGLVQLAHGMAEHKERYLPLMEFLCENGYACVINDHRGHGVSVKNQEDLGYMGENGAEALVEDLMQVGREARARLDPPHFCLMGHSMGSMAVRAWLKSSDEGLDGLIVCGCPSYNPAAPAGRALVKLLGICKGAHARSPMVEKLLFGGFNKSITGAKSPFSWLNTDADAVTAYEQDPLCGFPFTLNGYDSLLSLMCFIYDSKGWKATNSSLPIRFISGGDDPCMSNEAALERAAQLLRDAGYADVRTKIYPGMRHEILNEPGNRQVYSDVLGYLKEACKKG